MPEVKIIGYKTEFAPARRLPMEDLLRQHRAWAAQTQTNLISNASPNLMLILNECRQIVYSNDHFAKLGNFSNFEDYLGKRPGELFGCIHAFETEGGCGTTRFCRQCGVAKAILQGLSGSHDVEECNITLKEDNTELYLRVWTTPVELDGETYTIFSIQDISIERENRKLLEEVQKLAVLDPLTEINNRRAFFDMAAREITRALRYHNPFSVVMVDLDKFKQINDTYGHPVGDDILNEVVRLIKTQLRDVDFFARYGGDEFIVLLPETGLCGGQKFADRIMQLGDGSVFLMSDIAIPINFSAGVSEFIFDSDHDIDDVIERADKELYRVKRKRREPVIE